MRVYPLPVLSFTFPAMRQYYCPAMLVSFRRQIPPFQSANLVVAKCWLLRRMPQPLFLRRIYQR